MQALIQKLGKPRSFLVFAASCIASVVLGGLFTGLYFAGLKSVHLPAFLILVICWVIAAFSCISYYIGQISGRYRNLHGKRWSELPW